MCTEINRQVYDPIENSIEAVYGDQIRTYKYNPIDKVRFLREQICRTWFGNLQNLQNVSLYASYGFLKCCRKVELSDDDEQLIDAIRGAKRVIVRYINN